MADMTELKNTAATWHRAECERQQNDSRGLSLKYKKAVSSSGDLRIIKRPVYVVPAMESGSRGGPANTTLKYDYNGKR